MTAEVLRLPLVLRPGRYWQDLTEAELDLLEPWIEREVANGRAKLLRLCSTLGAKDWWVLFHVLERGAPYPIAMPEPSPRRVMVLEHGPGKTSWFHDVTRGALERSKLDPENAPSSLPRQDESRKRARVKRNLPDANRLALRAVTLSGVAVLHFLARAH